jgi:hypothetical protein
MLRRLPGLLLYSDVLCQILINSNYMWEREDIPSDSKLYFQNEVSFFYATMGSYLFIQSFYHSTVMAAVVVSVCMYMFVYVYTQ